MNNIGFSVDVDANEVKKQYEQEQEQKTFTPKKTQFNEKNYLQARLGKDEKSKTLTIRLLPFSPKGGTCFKKVYVHTVKVNKEVSPSGWKTFVCPTHNIQNGVAMGNGCPFCETSAKARELKSNSLDEPTKKKYGDIEFLNKVKEMWIVRCIERGHEEDGVKFWLFNARKDSNGIYDQLNNIADIRSKAAARKGNDYNVFSVKNGLDFIVTLTRSEGNKTSIKIVDEGIPSPLTEDMELGEKWLKDEKKWDEVYTVKPYDYMAIIAMGGVPVFNKELGKYVDKDEMNKIKEEAEQERIEKELTAETTDFSKIANGNDIIIDETEQANNEQEEDLPF